MHIYIRESTHMYNQVYICASKCIYARVVTCASKCIYARVVTCASVRVLAKISTQNPDVPDSLTCLTEYAKTIDFRFLNMSFD